MSFNPESQFNFASQRLKVRRLAQIDMRPIANRVASLMLDIVHEKFRSKEDPRGRKWKPWSPAYRQRIRGRGSLLKQSGELHDSVYTEVSSVTGDSAKLKQASELEYAGAHNDPKRPGYPKRQYLGMSRHDRRRIKKLFVGEIRKQINR